MNLKFNTSHEKNLIRKLGCLLVYSCIILTKVIHSEKCIISRFHCSMNIRECTYINLDSIVYYTPRLYGIPPSYMKFITDGNTVIHDCI